MMTGTDRIFVQRLAVFARHGAYAEERALGQRFYITLDCGMDLRKAGASDQLADTVSYADLAAIASRIATERRFNLLEALAETIATELLKAFPALHHVLVRIEKPSAPVPAIIDAVAVEIRRSRG